MEISKAIEYAPLSRIERFYKEKRSWLENDSCILRSGIKTSWRNFIALFITPFFVLFFVCKENRSRLNTNFNAQMFCLRHNQPQPANLLFKISVPSARLSLGHFRVPLTFKMRPSAQPFSWKWVLFAWGWKLFPYQTLNTSLVLIQRPGGTREWPITPMIIIWKD